LKDYRRRNPVTEITERRVVRTVTGLHRRVLWRMRELEIARLDDVLELAGNPVRRGGKPMRRDSLAHTLKRRRIDSETFNMLTEALRMDEVDGWDRPFPALPSAGERVDLIEATLGRLTAKGPGED